jgi:DNA-binding response OmpR family regulator
MMATVPPQQDIPLLSPSATLTRKIRILLVGDSRDEADIMKNALQEHCYVDVQLDAQKAYSSYRPRFYDVVFVNNTTNNMDGYQFYSKIRVIDKTTKVCLITAHPESMGQERGVAILSKPFDKATLFAKISTILEK